MVIDVKLALLFTPTMLLISATPGMCMTLAMTLGMSVGLRRTAWMMVGEVIGVLLVASLAGLGVAGIMLEYPRLFALFKWVGGAYIVWLGSQLWRSRGALSLDAETLEGRRDVSRRALATQGFVTAIANPKGWAFFMALLPPFLLTDSLINAHFVVLMLIIAVSELLCMTLYAAGGRTLRRLLSRRGNVAVVNRIAGTLMFGVGVWLALS